MCASAVPRMCLWGIVLTLGPSDNKTIEQRWKSRDTHLDLLDNIDSISMPIMFAGNVLNDFSAIAIVLLILNRYMKNSNKITKEYKNVIDIKRTVLSY